jgi:hypothetical protein
MRKRNKIILGVVFSLIIIGIITSTIFFFILRTQTNFLIETYDATRADNGTTLFADMHDTDNPRIVEVDMTGTILWEYMLPEDLRNYTNPGMDVEALSNGNILFVAPRKGIYEVTRTGVIAWSYLNTHVSHDADRLQNGNTLICWGGNDDKPDAQAIEVTPSGTIVWSWHAQPHYDVPPYDTISRQGWTHANAVHRLQNGNTLINLRNFNLTVEVNPTGTPVWEYDWTNLGRDPHDPELLTNNNLLIALQGPITHQAVEINRTTGIVVWQYGRTGTIFARDCDRLPNGNTLITAIVDQRSKIFEVTPSGDIVWELAWSTTITPIPGWFYKAERII